MKTQKQLEDSLLEIWCSTEEAASEADYREDLRQMHRQMGVGGRPRFLARTWFYAAAAAAVLLLVMVGEYHFLNKHTQPVERMSYVTSSASKGEFVLPDGSHVWLNSGSSLSFDKANPRDVTLEGEGFFDVAKKDGQPFVVHTGTMAVKVLGTRFNVRSSSHFEQEEVSLVSGRVEILSGDNTVQLSPGEKAGIAGSVIEKKTADVSLDASWIGQELVFDNVALQDILTSLEHWYNVNIRVASDVNPDARLSFKLRKETLPEAQRIVSRITGYRFKTLDEHNIILSRQ
ncbi:MAG: FecR family protein [Bacteroidales bacterium]|nr:FecR family protein [Bacteroidales bacterium]